MWASGLVSAGREPERRGVPAGLLQAPEAPVEEPVSPQWPGQSHPLCRGGVCCPSVSGGSAEGAAGPSGMHGQGSGGGRHEERVRRATSLALSPAESPGG